MTISTKHYVAVNLGSGPNTGTGDDLLTAFNKINQNFGNYESVGFPTGDISASGTVQAAYFIGDGSQLTAIPTTGLYSNANVASYLPTYSGSVANVTVTGNITLLNPLTSLVVSGNTYLGGAQVNTGYRQLYPTANVALTANVNVSRILVTPTPSGGIPSFFVDVTLPNVVVDGTTITVSSNVAINQLRALGSWTTTVSPSTNVAVVAGTSVSYFYRSGDNVWYRV